MFSCTIYRGMIWWTWSARLDARTLQENCENSLRAGFNWTIGRLLWAAVGLEKKKKKNQCNSTCCLSHPSHSMPAPQQQLTTRLQNTSPFVLYNSRRINAGIEDKRAAWLLSANHSTAAVELNTFKHLLNIRSRHREPPLAPATNSAKTPSSI